MNTEKSNRAVRYRKYCIISSINVPFFLKHYNTGYCIIYRQIKGFSEVDCFYIIKNYGILRYD